MFIHHHFQICQAVKRWLEGGHAAFTQDMILLIRTHNLSLVEFNPGILQLIRTK